MEDIDKIRKETTENVENYTFCFIKDHDVS